MTDQTQPPKAQTMNWFSRIAHPGVFLNWSKWLVRPLAVISALLFALGLWYAFFNSPPDYQMGDTVRLMYIHVPNAWLSQMCYGVMAVSAIGTLVWRHPLSDLSMKAAAPLGAVFTAMALFTGAMWGRPTWGTYWEWDGRMTSTFVLFLMYLGIIAIWRAFDDQSRAAKLVAVFTLVGTINIPIIKFSVDWWNTLHQPSIISSSGLSMPPAIYTPLMIMMLAFTCLFITLQIVGMRTEIYHRRTQSLERQRLAQSQSDSLSQSSVIQGSPTND